MKIIFLDYDGVVNNLVFHDINGEPDFYCKDFNDDNKRMVNDFQAVAWLNKICREFNCKVVVTSTWRGDTENYKEFLYRAGFTGEIIGRTTIEGGLAGYRGKQIAQWWHDNKNLKYKGLDFIILDDDGDMEPYMDHLIQTNSYRGLGFEEYQKICKRWEK